MIAKVMTSYAGSEKSTAEIWKLVHAEFPSFKKGSLLPNDHSNKGNKHPCWCAGTENRIFDQIEHGRYRVLNVSIHEQQQRFYKSNLVDDVLSDDPEETQAKFDIPEAQSEDALTPDTEIQRLVWLRRNQSKFSAPVKRYWLGRCAVTNIEAESLLQACHIKPFSESNDNERLDAYNGLYLSASIHCAFDAHLIGFAPGGEICFSDRLSQEDRQRLGLNGVAKIALSERHAPYIADRHKRFLEANSFGTSTTKNRGQNT